MGANIRTIYHVRIYNGKVFLYLDSRLPWNSIERNYIRLPIYNVDKSDNIWHGRDPIWFSFDSLGRLLAQCHYIADGTARLSYAASVSYG